MTADPRLLLLTLPSALVLALLAVHSLEALPRRRALGFWAAVTLFGISRGLAVRWITQDVLGAPFPYEIRRPLFELAGVSVQEVAGWAIVAYVGWWLGWSVARRLSGGAPRLFPQVLWACLFLGAVSWAVESAAVAAGWWFWRVPARNPLLFDVPAIGLVDWAMVGTDFLLPFLALTSPALAGWRRRWLTLLVFPLHFGAHAIHGPLHSAFPVPALHLAHWGSLAVVLWLALRSRATDDAFSRAPAARRGRGVAALLPAVGLAVVLLVVACVYLFVAGRPGLLPALLPAVAVGLQSLWPRAGTALAVAALVVSPVLPPLALAAVPAGVAALLRLGEPRRRWVAVAALLLLAVTAYHLHSREMERRQALTADLERAVAARDRGDLATARGVLERALQEHPGEHAPALLLGEIHYRTGRLHEARRQFERVVEIQPDSLRAHRFLAVIALRQGDPQAALEAARRGLAYELQDLELSYLAARASGEGLAELLPRTERAGPERAGALAALAFEVGDAEGAALLLDRALELWPGQRSLYPARVKLALAAGDRETAGRTLDRWLEQFPADAEARRLLGGTRRP